MITFGFCQCRMPALMLICLGLLLGLLAGCATSAPAPSLFVLAAGASAPASTAPPGAPALIVAPVATAAYLDQGGIVYQTAPHRVVIANDNRWVSPLSGQLTDDLYATLSRRLPGVHVVRASGHRQVRYQLHTRVDQFLGQYDGKARISGRWTLIDSSGKTLADHNFNEAVPLTADGYPALVTSLSKGWQIVARNMVPTLERILRPDSEP